MSAFMDTTTQNTHAIMDDIVTLRIQLAAISSQLQPLKPAFFDTCAELDRTPLKLDSAVISRTLTVGQWDYPEDPERLTIYQLQISRMLSP